MPYDPLKHVLVLEKNIELLKRIHETNLLKRKKQKEKELYHLQLDLYTKQVQSGVVEEPDNQGRDTEHQESRKKKRVESTLKENITPESLTCSEIPVVKTPKPKSVKKKHSKSFEKSVKTMEVPQKPEPRTLPPVMIDPTNFYKFTPELSDSIVTWKEVISSTHPGSLSSFKSFERFRMEQAFHEFLSMRLSWRDIQKCFVTLKNGDTIIGIPSSWADAFSDWLCQRVDCGLLDNSSVKPKPRLFTCQLPSRDEKRSWIECVKSLFPWLRVLPMHLDFTCDFLDRYQLPQEVVLSDFSEDVGLGIPFDYEQKFLDEFLLFFRYDLKNANSVTKPTSSKKQISCSTLNTDVIDESSFNGLPALYISPEKAIPKEEKVASDTVVVAKVKKGKIATPLVTATPILYHNLINQEMEAKWRNVIKNPSMPFMYNLSYGDPIHVFSHHQWWSAKAVFYAYTETDLLLKVVFDKWGSSHDRYIDLESRQDYLRAADQPLNNTKPNGRKIQHQFDINLPNPTGIVHRREVDSILKYGYLLVPVYEKPIVYLEENVEDNGNSPPWRWRTDLDAIDVDSRSLRTRKQSYDSHCE